MNPNQEDPTPKRRRPVYTISIAAQLTELPIYTIRWLEAHELIDPYRSQGNQRLFCDEDIELLQEIAALLERKVNLAGIQTILQIKRTYHITHIEISEEEEEP